MREPRVWIGINGVPQQGVTVSYPGSDGLNLVYLNGSMAYHREGGEYFEVHTLPYGPYTEVLVHESAQA